MSNECQKPEIRAHRATEWSAIKQRCGAHGGGGGLWGGDWTQTGTALEEGACGFVGAGRGSMMKMEKIQLLSSSSVAVSTSQDFDDNATITAFWKRADRRAVKEWDISATALKRERERNAYFFKAHGTEFVYFACVFRTGNRSARVDVRPEPGRLFEHLWVLLVLWKTQRQAEGEPKTFQVESRVSRHGGKEDLTKLWAEKLPHLAGYCQMHNNHRLGSIRQQSVNYLNSFNL